MSDKRLKVLIEEINEVIDITVMDELLNTNRGFLDDDDDTDDFLEAEQNLKEYYLKHLTQYFTDESQK